MWKDEKHNAAHRQVHTDPRESNTADSIRQHVSENRRIRVASRKVGVKPRMLPVRYLCQQAFNERQTDMLCDHSLQLNCYVNFSYECKPSSFFSPKISGFDCVNRSIAGLIGRRSFGERSFTSKDQKTEYRPTLWPVQLVTMVAINANYSSDVSI